MTKRRGMAAAIPAVSLIMFLMKIFVLLQVIM